MASPLKTVIDDEAFGLRVHGEAGKRMLVLHWHQTAAWGKHGLQYIGQLLPRNDGVLGYEWLIVWEGYDSVVYQFETRTDNLDAAIALIEEDFIG